MLHSQPEWTITNGSRKAPTYIRYKHVSTDIPLYVCLFSYRNSITLCRFKKCSAKQDKANACYDEVSCFISFSPGFIRFITGNISERLSSLMWLKCLCCYPTEETKVPTFAHQEQGSDKIQIGMEWNGMELIGPRTRFFNFPLSFYTLTSSLVRFIVLLKATSQ